MARVRVVLVRPENAANVGACARVVRNAGAEGLDLVDPGDWRTVECWRTAWGAHEVLEEARVFPDLASALGGVALAVALSGRRAGRRVARRHPRGRGRHRRARGRRGGPPGLRARDQRADERGDRPAAAGSRPFRSDPAPALVQPVPRGGDRGVRGAPGAVAAAGRPRGPGPAGPPTTRRSACSACCARDCWPSRRCPASNTEGHFAGLAGPRPARRPEPRGS